MNLKSFIGGSNKLSTIQRAKALLLAVLRRQFVRFLLVGVMNTAFTYAIYALLLFLGVNFALANLGAVSIGILFSFKTHGYLVFRNPANRLLFKYITFWFLICLCNIGVIKLLLMTGLNAYEAGAAALLPIGLLSYTMQKYAVFKPVFQLGQEL